MALRIERGRRRALPIYCLLMGGPGSGKTMTGIALAHHLVAQLPQGKRGPGRPLVIDAEVIAKGEDATARSEMYQGDPCPCQSCRGHGLEFDFDVIRLDQDNANPDGYSEALTMGENEGYPVVFVDNISQEWQSILRWVDQLKKANSRADPWLKATPVHESFVRRLLTYPGHLIATVRTKEKFDRTQKGPGGGYASLGQQPIFRDGIEYEFDVSAFMADKTAMVVKARSQTIDGNTYHLPGFAFARDLLAWAARGKSNEAPKGVGGPGPVPNPPKVARQAPRPKECAQHVAWAPAERDGVLGVTCEACGIFRPDPAMEQNGGDGTGPDPTPGGPSLGGQQGAPADDLGVDFDDAPAGDQRNPDATPPGAVFTEDEIPMDDEGDARESSPNDYIAMIRDARKPLRGQRDSMANSYLSAAGSDIDKLKQLLEWVNRKVAEQPRYHTKLKMQVVEARLLSGDEAQETPIVELERLLREASARRKAEASA